MRLAEHFIFFRNELSKFNNTGARMLDSIYHMILLFYFEFIFLA